MPLALSISTEDIVDGLFLAVATIVGFLGGGVIGLVVGLLAGYAYLELTGRVADLEATVNALVREKEELRERVDALESDRDAREDGRNASRRDG